MAWKRQSSSLGPGTDEQQSGRCDDSTKSEFDLLFTPFGKQRLFNHDEIAVAQTASVVKHMKMTETTPSYYCLRRTPFGSVAVLWTVHRGRPKIWRALLSKPLVSAKHIVQTSFPDVMPSSCAEVDFVADQIAAFLTGEDICFSLDIVRLDLCSRFQQIVLLAEHGIPRGRVSTYHRIANHLGNANDARAVGRALATNPFPIIIPCHRAIRSDGTLGGYQGGIEMKRALLKMEGFLFDPSGRVINRELFY